LTFRQFRAHGPLRWGRITADITMSNAKIISIMDHEVRQTRTTIYKMLTRLQLDLSTELVNLSVKVMQLRADVDTLMLRQYVHPSLPQDERSRIVEQGGGLPPVK
jgi:hypothetical protein